MPDHAATSLKPSTLVFGVVFATIGAGPLVLSLFTDAPLAFGLFSLPFMCVGLAIAFYRRGFELDVGNRTVTTWRGVWFPMLRSEHTLGELTHVSIREETRGSGKSRRTMFVVYLEPGSLEVMPADLYLAARRGAETAAKALDLALHDGSMNTLAIREAGTLDEPLRDRLIREHGGAAPPHAVPVGRLLVSAGGEETVCTIPAEGLDVARLGRAAPALFGLVPAAFVVATGGFPLAIAGVVLGVASTAFVVFGLPALAAILVKGRVRYSKAGLTYAPPLGFAARIPADELEELLVAPAVQVAFMSLGGGIIARSDARAMRFGSGLSHDERQWLHQAICHTLVTQAWGYRQSPKAG